MFSRALIPMFLHSLLFHGLGDAINDWHEGFSWELSICLMTQP